MAMVKVVIYLKDDQLRAAKSYRKSVHKPRGVKIEGNVLTYSASHADVREKLLPWLGFVNDSEFKRSIYRFKKGGYVIYRVSGLPYSVPIDQTLDEHVAEFGNMMFKIEYLRALLKAERYYECFHSIVMRNLINGLPKRKSITDDELEAIHDLADDIHTGIATHKRNVAQAKAEQEAIEAKEAARAAKKAALRNHKPIVIVPVRNLHEGVVFHHVPKERVKPIASKRRKKKSKYASIYG